MKAYLYPLYIIYQFLVIAACVYLPFVFGFGVEYVLLGIQSILVILYFLWFNPPKKPSKTKYASELS